MTRLVWDTVGDRVYETGLDRGVLYLPNGVAVPWNGLRSVSEKFDTEVSPVYYDGMKIHDNVSPGAFSGSLKAITYPDEFAAMEGIAPFVFGADGVPFAREGMYVGGQDPKTFGLSYRTLVGNDLEESAGYKIHLLYNVTAAPTNKDYQSATNEPNITEFEWDIYATPEEVRYALIRPTAYFSFDSTRMDPLLFAELEDKLYGTDSTPAALLSMADLIAFISTWYRIDIIDYGDGTWAAATTEPDLIVYLDPPTNSIWQINDVNATYTDADTYVVSDTRDISEVP